MFLLTIHCRKTLGHFLPEKWLKTMEITQITLCKANKFDGSYASRYGHILRQYLCVSTITVPGQEYLNKLEFVSQVAHDRDTYATSNISP